MYNKGQGNDFISSIVSRYNNIPVVVFLLYSPTILMSNIIFYSELYLHFTYCRYPKYEFWPSVSSCIRFVHYIFLVVFGVMPRHGNAVIGR